MRITLLNQCFYPDVASSGQHLTDLALALAERGHSVTVISSDRAYDSPARRFARREHWQGVKIIRLPSLGLGKTSRWRRAAGFGTLLLAYVLRLIVTPRQDVVVAMTSPPLIAFVASWFVRIKGGRLVYWILDLNPDEALAAGWLRQDALVTRLLDGFQNFALRQAETVVVLDRFMQARIADKGIALDKLKVIRLWPHDDAVTFNQSGRTAFRLKHQLDEKFVVMYAGNHSPCHPLSTLLAAAEGLREHKEIAFCFIGGGSEFAGVKEFASSRALSNITCLSYQPRVELAASLSAADLHVVVMGDPFVGIVHPCKIYNVLRVGAPFIYIGPAQSHVTDIVQELNGELPAYLAEHGAVDQVKQHILNAAAHFNPRPMRSISNKPAHEGLANLIDFVEAAHPRSAADDSLTAGSSAAPAAAVR